MKISIFLWFYKYEIRRNELNIIVVIGEYYAWNNFNLSVISRGFILYLNFKFYVLF